MLLTEINKEIFLLKLREIENYISEKQINKVSKNSNLNIFNIKNKLFINNNNIVSSILFLLGYKILIFLILIEKYSKKFKQKFNNNKIIFFWYELKEQSIENEIQRRWIFFDKINNIYRINSIKYKRRKINRFYF